MTKHLLLPLFLCVCLLPLSAQNEKPAAQATPAAHPTKKTTPDAPANSSVLTPTPLQLANMHIAQLQFSAAQKDAQEALNNFIAVCNSAKVENGWPKDATCDLRDLSVHPPAPEAASAPKPEEPKK